MRRHLLLLITILITITFSFGRNNGLLTVLDSGGVGRDSIIVKKNIDESTSSKRLGTYTTQIKNFNFTGNDFFGDEKKSIVPFSVPEPLDPKQEYYNKRAELLMAKVKAENRFVKFLDSSSLIDLPIGLVGEVGKEDYAILIDSLVITPAYAYLTVYMCIPIPQSDQKLVFRGDNIRLSKEAGITGDARIFLVNDVGFKLFGTESQMIVRGGPNKTYALWDCNGFKETNVVTDVEFSRNWLIPVKGDGNVTSHFETRINDWNNLVVTVSLDPFSLTALKGVEFHAANAVFDHSDFDTPATIKFPKGYTSSQFIGDDKKLWRGFYMEDLTVVLPKEFKRQGDQTQISFSGQQVIIDNNGFTGNIGVSNLFTLKQGDMNGWDYSLDSLGISFMSNNLVGAGFKGKIVLPIGNDDKPLGYKAIINPGTSSYVFTVETLKELDFEIWKAKVMLLPGSHLEVSSIDGKFKPKAILSGSMDVRSQADAMSLFDVKFEELVVMSESPYLDAKAFSFGSEQLEHTMKDFPISISRIGFRRKASDKVALTFTIGVHLSGQDDGAFKGDATFELLSKRDETSKKWKYDHIAVSEIGIDIDGGSYKIKGRIKIFEDDLLYGKGFNGTVTMTFEPNLLLSGTVIFGRVDDYRYWYADAFVGLPQGLPFCGFLAFYGFGGGMYHNMEQVGFSKDEKYGPGTSLSGVIYKPSKKIRYGFKATIQIGLTSSKETFNGDVTFEISFNQGGGVKRISLLGNAYVFMSQQFGDTGALTGMVEKMAKPTASYGVADPGDIHATSGLKPPGKDALISGHLFQYYDFENHVLHGEMEMYVDIFGALKGIGPDGLAGWSVVHYSQDEWFIYIGTPDRRVGLNLLNLMIVDGYFMAGSKIPGSPPPPPEVSRMFDNIDLDYMRDENALGTGKGVAFGGSFSMKTPDLSFMMFYGKFGMGAGFDVMLKNYGHEVRCKGRNSPLGINGWYANGQIYAYVEGSIGMQFKLFGKKKKKEILSIAAAVVFQSKLPNPFWMNGTVGGHFSILGGLVKGNCQFQLEVGEKCEIIDGSVLSGLDVIADATPAPNATDVDVFTSPQVIFNFETGKEFSMVDVDDVLKTFRIKLDYFTIKDDATEIPASLVWNTEHTVLVYKSNDVLTPSKALTLDVQISFEEKVRGVWTPVKVDGKVFTERKTQTFTTGVAPDYIPKENIAYSYPQLNQFNFYKSEFTQGYIKLKKGQPYLFNVSPGLVQKGRLVTLGGSKTYFDFTYNDLQIDFTLPSSMQTEKVYNIQLVNVPADSYQPSALDANVVEETTKVTLDNVQLDDIETTRKKAEGTIKTLKEMLLFQGYFRTSKYSTFSAKLAGLNLSTGWFKPDSRAQGVFILGANMPAIEYFDKAELSEVNGMSRFVNLEANLNNNSYYQNKVYPLVYQDYTTLTPYAKVGAGHNFGAPPVKATYLFQDYIDKELTDADIASHVAINPATSGTLNYDLNYYMYKDYQSLQTQTAYYITYSGGVVTPRRKYILENAFPVIQEGDYEINIRYVLPGTGRTTTDKIIKIYNPLKVK